MSASNVTSTVDDRQDPVSKDLETPCPVCVQSGFACAKCFKSFVLYDLRAVTNDGHRHLACADWTTITAVDLLSMDCQPESPFGRQLVSDGLRLVAAALAAASDQSAFRRELCTARVAYYSRDLCADRAGHRAHVVGGPDRGCDFCSVKPASRSWKLPTFHHASLTEPGAIILCYEGDWRACATCVTAVERKDVGALALRGMALASAPGLTNSRRRKHYTRLYGKVLAEIGAIA